MRISFSLALMAFAASLLSGCAQSHYAPYDTYDEAAYERAYRDKAAARRKERARRWVNSSRAGKTRTARDQSKAKSENRQAEAEQRVAMGQRSRRQDVQRQSPDNEAIAAHRPGETSAATNNKPAPATPLAKPTAPPDSRPAKTATTNAPGVRASPAGSEAATRQASAAAASTMPDPKPEARQEARSALITPAEAAPNKGGTPQVGAAADAEAEALALKQVQEGYRLLKAGFVKKSRERFEAALKGKSGPASLGLGRSLDPTYLKGIAYPDVEPDGEQARRHYRRAILLGESEARVDLERLEKASAAATPPAAPVAR